MCVIHERIKGLIFAFMKLLSNVCPSAPHFNQQSVMFSQPLEKQIREASKSTQSLMQYLNNTLWPFEHLPWKPWPIETDDVN